MRKLLNRIKGSPTPRRRNVITNEQLLVFRQEVLKIAATERGNRRKALDMYKYLTAEMLRRGM